MAVARCLSRTILAAVISVPVCVVPTAAAGRRQERSSCVEFLSPRPGGVVTVPTCTISVAACPVVSSIRFRAVYFREDGQTKDSVDLGVIERPPYKRVWNLESVPNQLLSGATLLAETEFLNGEKMTVRQEGVFLVHRPTKRPSVDVSRLGRLGLEESRGGMDLRGPDSSVSGSARAYWDKQNLVFAVTVKDPSYRSGIPEPQLRATSCELLLDPSVGGGLPYPSDSVIAVQIPLLGEVQRKRYQALFTRDGGFSVGARFEPYTQHHSVKTADGKGWKAICVVPPSLLGPHVPQSVRCNVVVRIADQTGATDLLSWTGTNLAEMYAPRRWGVVVLRTRPLSQRPGLLYLIGLAAGMLFMLVAYPVCGRLATNNAMVLTFETPEGERKICEMVRAFIETRIPDKTLSLEALSEEFAIETHRIDKLLKKYTGQLFHPYLMGLRIEIAKERLRSTNASESSIAEQCGFKSTEEMERMFMKIGGTTPYKFRLEQQVT